MTGKLPNQPHCPACRKILDGFDCISHDGNPKPDAGDITICSYCITPLEFTADSEWRTLDLGTLPTEMIMDVRRAIRVAEQFQAFRRSMKN